MFGSYLKLTLAALAPVILLVIFYFLDKKTKFGNLHKNLKQVIYGVAFGGLAIMGTEYGVPLNGAQMNCRDAAVITAGLFLGGPAGIIAGFIGGIERWFSVYWGISSFTRVACSVSTFLAGVYSAVIKKYMLDNKKPHWFFAFIVAVVIEVFHLSMVFVTNLNTPNEALNVVRVCTIPLVTANGVSVLISGLVITLLNKEKLISRKKIKNISKIIQRWLLVTVFCAFFVSTYLVFTLQNQMANTEAKQLLTTSIHDAVNDINDASDRNMISKTKLIAKKISESPLIDLEVLADEEGISEIHLINNEAKIYRSTNIALAASLFDMRAAGGQSEEFCIKIIDEGMTEFVQPYGPTSSDPNKYIKYAGVKTENGFVQIGYNGAKIQSDLKNQLMYITNNRTVGENGFLVVLYENPNKKLEILSSPININLDDYQDEIGSLKVNEMSTIKIDGSTHYVYFEKTESYYIISLISEEELTKNRVVAVYVNTFLQIIVYGVMFIVLYILIKKVVVDKLDVVNESLSKISSGNLDVVVDVRGNEEFVSLSNDINSTVDTLKEYISEASRRIDAELETAKNIQNSALPQVTQTINSNKVFNIYASMNPAKEVGGDFYDFYYSKEEEFNVLIADVSGKGIPAAMFMMRGKAELKNLTESFLSLDEVYKRCNDTLCSSNDAGMFITAWQASINLQNGNVKFVNAGHNPPVIKRRDGKFEYFKSKAGFVLAGMEGFPYKVQDLKLERGDILYLYTDGVTEATNINNELYGEQRLLDILNSKEFVDMEEMCHLVKEDVDKFTGEADQFDDITMLGFKYLGPSTQVFTVEDAKLEDIRDITEFVETELEKMDCPMKVSLQISVAIDEIVSNIIKYGYVNTSGPITVEVKGSEEGRVAITFIDKGIPYNPLHNMDPDVTLSLEERKVGGLGIYLVKKTMDEVKYKYEKDENVLTIIKRF